MTNIKNSSNVQLRPLAITLSNGCEFSIAAGMCCPKCGDGVRVIDAEPLHAGMRVVCRCGFLLVNYEPA
jgi:hypothetical protein